MIFFWYPYSQMPIPCEKPYKSLVFYRYFWQSMPHNDFLMHGCHSTSGSEGSHGYTRKLPYVDKTLGTESLDCLSITVNYKAIFAWERADDEVFDSANHHVSAFNLFQSNSSALFSIKKEFRISSCCDWISLSIAHESWRKNKRLGQDWEFHQLWWSHTISRRSARWVTNEKLASENTWHSSQRFDPW